MADQPVSQSSSSAGAGLESLATALRTCFRLLIAVMIGAIVLFLWKSFFVVEQHEVGLVLRFGKLVGDLPQEQVLQTDLHFTWPYPVDEKIRVSKRVQTVESATHWYAEDQQAGEPPPTLRPGVDGYMLTGDVSVHYSKWVLRYKIGDPVRYAFAFSEQPGSYSETDRFLRLLLDSTVTEVCAGMTIDEAWSNRDLLRARVEDRLRQRLEKLDIGIDTHTADALEVLPVDVTPPRQVSQAFLDVTRAGEEKRRLLDDAQAFETRVVNEAATTANRLRSEAMTFKDEKIRQSNADLATFTSLRKELGANPGLVRQSLLEDMLRRVLPRVEEKFFIDSRTGREVRLQLSRQPDERKEAAP